MQRLGLRLALAAGLVALATTAQAGIIPNGTYTAGTPSTNNATATITNNAFGITGFNLDSTAKNIQTKTGAIDLVFPVVANGKTLTYSASEGVTDNVPKTRITKLVMQLGFGTGAGFTQVGLPAALVFTPTSTPTSSNMGNGAGAGTATLTYAGSPGINSGQTGTFQFQFDVPDLPAGKKLTLREVATLTAVPEPSSLAMAGLGGLGLLGLALRRRGR